MRVCLLAYRQYESNTHMMQFVHALVRRGDRVDVVCAGTRGAPNHELIGGAHVWRIQRRDLDEKSCLRYGLKLAAFMLRAALFLTRAHLREPFQLIHVQSVPDFLIFAAALPKLLGTPVILDFRDLVPELYASRTGAGDRSTVVKMLLLVERASCALADHILVANPLWYKRIIGRSADPAKCALFWYQPDPSIFYPRKRQRTDGAFRIMYPCNLNYHQGLDIAIGAFRRIARVVPDGEFYIYGDGSERKALAAQIKSLDLDGQVKLLGIIPVEEVPQAMAESDVGIVPKRASCRFGDEAASTKIFEFMAVGVPVAVSRTTIDRCYFDDSLVRYFEPENEDDLVCAVVSLYRDHELRQGLIEHGIQFIREGRWGSSISEYLAIVDSLSCPTALQVQKSQ